MNTMASALWHRVEGLHLHLKPSLEIERHVVRGEVWYAAWDRFANRVHRLSTGAYAVLIRLDGQRTVAEVWDEVVSLFGEDAPSQDEVIHLVGQLYSADLISADGAVDMHELSERADRTRQRQLMQRVQNPLFFRLPLFDPDRFFAATLHLVRPLFGVAGLSIWLGGMVWLVTQAALHWSELTTNAADRVLAPDNLVLIILIFPAVKLLHELGHGYAAKLGGGDVNEIGVIFLVFVPAPYVEASSSAVFSSKWRRMLVGAAGMITELSLAVVAMVVWTGAEPGLVRSIAFNVLLICGVSTLIFNGNPLLRFDAYYILGDLLEIPNLGSRSNRYVFYLIQHYLFGLESVTNPSTGRGERFWFLLYAPASFAYRLTVTISIATFLGTHYFFIGAVLATWAVTLAVLWPLVKGLRYVATAPALGGRRLRAGAVAAAGVALLLVGLFVVDIPRGTVAQGVVAVPEGARVFAETDGDVVRLVANVGSRVRAGDPLIELGDPYVAARMRLAAAQLSEMQRRLAASEPNSPFESVILRKQVGLAESELAEARRKVSALVIKAKADGLFYVPRALDVTGLHVKNGQLMGYVMPESDPLVRVAVPEAEIDIVRHETRSVSVRSPGLSGTILHDVKVSREVPGAAHQLPSPALDAKFGGPFALDPAAKDPDTSLLPFFEVDLFLASSPLTTGLWGERVWVRFDHGASPVAVQLYRMLRQTFLARFNV